MRCTTLFISFILTVTATIIMSYISMTAPIGPWIETTLVLCSMIMLKFIPQAFKINNSYTEDLGLTTVAGGIGGILATAFGFSLPTLYFIDPETFNLWLSQPLKFSIYLSGLALSAGSFGLLVANIFEKKLIIKEQLAFPIGELIYKMIAAQDQIKKAFSLALGFVTTNIFLLLTAFGTFLKIIPKQISLIKKYSLNFLIVPEISIPLTLVPMLWAVGFITGHVIAIPLLMGVFSKIFVLEPVYYVYSNFQANLSNNDFTIAFCSGMVLYSSLIGFIYLSKTVYLATKETFSTNIKANIKKINFLKTNFFKTINLLKQTSWLQLIFVLSINFIFLSYFNFSIISQLYLLIFSFICTYQLLIIAGKIGLAPLGRFATFVMVPGMFLFGFDPVQVTFVASFVEIAGGVGCDALFGRKMGNLASISSKKVAAYQWFGLIVSSLVIGIIFWLFIFNFGLGGNINGSLPVTKAASRALLINIKNFNFSVLLVGMLFSYILKFTKISPMLVLGGILMPINFSLILVAGGLSTYLFKNKEDFYPFWSGVFAANSFWMLLKTFIISIFT